MTDEPALRKIPLIGCSESMWKAPHSQIGMQVALLSPPLSDWDASGAFELWMKEKVRIVNQQVPQHHSTATPVAINLEEDTDADETFSSMTGRSGSNHDFNLLTLYNKLCILKVNLTLFLIGQFDIYSVSTIVMLFARM